MKMVMTVDGILDKIHVKIIFSTALNTNQIIKINLKESYINPILILLGHPELSKEKEGKNISSHNKTLHN